MTTISVAAGAVIFTGLIYRLYSRSWKGELPRLHTSRDVGPLLDRLQRLRPNAAADAFNSAIRQLWDAYERELAARLIRALAERHTDAPIAQYWLDQIQHVEPELAATHLGSEFIARYYRPQVASSCGPCGCTL